MDSRPIPHSSFFSRMEREMASTNGDMTIDLIERREHIQLQSWQRETIRRTLDTNDRIIHIQTGRRAGKSFLASLMAKYMQNTRIVVPSWFMGREYRSNDTLIYEPGTIHEVYFDTLICDELEPTNTIIENIISRCDKAVFISSYALTSLFTITNSFNTGETKIEKDWDD